VRLKLAKSGRSISTPNYLNRAQIEAVLEEFLCQECMRWPEPVVLDVGGGDARYRRFVPENARYICVDAFAANPGGVIAKGEFLPIRDGSCDIVICIQVLEHVEDPHRVVAEIGRVLRPGGSVLLTTHGTMPYHPSPQDYWRWTQQGLVRLFRETNLFEHIELIPIGSTVTTLGFLVSWYLHLFGSAMARRMPSLLGRITVIVTRMMVALINLMILGIQDRCGWLIDPSSSNTLFLSFAIKARRT
jgi:SAM-dependent methyltransferase